MKQNKLLGPVVLIQLLIQLWGGGAPLSPAPSGSVQEAQVDGFGGDHQRSRFGLHRRRRLVHEPHVVRLHQLWRERGERLQSKSFQQHQREGAGLNREGAFSGPHPGQGEVHLHLRHPPPHAAAHADPERDVAVGVVLVAPPPTAAAAATAAAATQPALRQEGLGVVELRLVVTDGVVTQVELSLDAQERPGSAPPLPLAPPTPLATPTFGFLPSWGTSSLPGSPHAQG